MEFEPPIIWFAVGIIFLLLEAFSVSGVGFLFAGLGALAVGLVVEAELAGHEEYWAQLAWFFALTAFSALVLWKPMRRWYSSSRPGAQNFSNIIGETAVAGPGDLVRGRLGQAQWSGTIMRAEISALEVEDSLPEGTRVLIVGITGATLLVKRAE